MEQDDGEDMRGAPIGRDDFKRIRDMGLLYVDKTGLIPEVLRNSGKGVLLFTRPRRFGKTLNLSMMDAFFNLRYKGNAWFEGLAVDGAEDAARHKSAYPVVRISLGGLSTSRFEYFFEELRGKIASAYMDFGYLRDSDRIDGVLRKEYLETSASQFDRNHAICSVSMLCAMLEAHHGVSPIVLIDEYDSPINSSMDKDAFDEIAEFLRSFYTATLKDNAHISFAVVTGVMQIAKESIFSGLNNLYVNNILSEDFSECFGFTRKDVKDVLDEAGHPEKFDECRGWYDGYRFGSTDVYNPWSILNYVDRGCRPDVYWANTSSNDIIGNLVDLAGQDTLDELAALGSGGSVTKRVEPAVPVRGLLSRKDSIYSVMAMSGYLNAVACKGGHRLSVPNREVFSVFRDALLDRAYTDVQSQFRLLFQGLEKGDIGAIEENAYSILAGNAKSFQLKDEGDYQLLVAGAAMAMLGSYRVRMEEEAGNGRADLIMERNSGRRPNIVVEFKRAKPGEDLLAGAEEGLWQIKEKGYHDGMKGRTILYGICFRNKEAKAVSERVRASRPLGAR
ncbi:MAG: AAA family ATPase [Candidatus Methanomethylophilaceae archaeon]|nr:AAA family ATPase [Candidatus Methanomethylophilaceae archaeon]